ncbi:MAG: ferredoxin III, nif-specific [Defluviicoccus sp.]|nr:MAG: ferredoxin III, nif-specific [Defluviicoccus sp.]
MADGQFVTRDGSPWVPLYLESINEEKCIGCGRCNKVCSHGVLGVKGLTEENEDCEIDDEEMERMVSTVINKGACIGCNACALVCGAKGAQNHVSALDL